MITTLLKYNSSFRNNSIKIAFVSATMEGDAKRYRSFFWESMQNITDPRINLEEPDKPKTPFYINEISYPDTGGNLLNPKPIYKKAIEEAVRLSVENKNKMNQNILIILPGQKEIIKACQNITKLTPNDVICLPLFSNLSNLATNTALSTPPNQIIRARDDFEYKSKNSVSLGTYKIKVIIATDIAEASLTVNGLSFVIDSGITKKPIYKPNRGFQIIENKWISLQSHIQRRGRVGRERPGTFIYLYSKDDLTNIPNYEICTSSTFTDTIFNIYTSKKFQYRISINDLLDANGTFYFIHPNELDHSRIEPNENINKNIGKFKDPRPSEYVESTLFYLNLIINFDSTIADLIMEVSNSLKDIPDFYPDIWFVIALTISANYGCLKKMSLFLAIINYSFTDINFYRQQIKLINNTFLDYRIKNLAQKIELRIKSLNIQIVNINTFENCLASSMQQKLVYYQKVILPNL